MSVLDKYRFDANNFLYDITHFRAWTLEGFVTANFDLLISKLVRELHVSDVRNLRISFGFLL